jgi:GNAT superfamily N-acetyltransferase
MKITLRNYTAEPGFTADYNRVHKFLLRINRKNPIQHDFEWGRWEWGFSLPYLETDQLSKMGIWEHNGKIVGITAFEYGPGIIYPVIDPEYTYIKEAMVQYAREHLGNAEGKLQFLINNNDWEFQKIARRNGFYPSSEKEGNSVLDLDEIELEYTIPEGFVLKSVADGFDVAKFNAALWKGFNHEGNPPESEEQLIIRKKQITAPHQNPELCIAVLEPGGDYVSYCGVWYDSQTEYSLVEPCATVPEYRKMGLGRAALYEAVKRSKLLGAKLCYVGSDQQFYYSLGFRPLAESTFWSPKG